MKYVHQCRIRNEMHVAPHWGAWIEIPTSTGLTISWHRSHPTGVRGLKSRSEYERLKAEQSHPTGVRGLKFVRPDACIYNVSGRTPLGCVD